MGVDLKYGRITVEHERRIPIGDDEPVFLFRAKDELLPALLDQYLKLCDANGCTPEHLAGIAAACTEVVDWQRANGTPRPGDQPHAST